MKRKILTIFINIFLPLAVGLCIYLLFYNGTYLNSIFGIELSFKANSLLGIFMKSWACDILWAYSLTYSLYFVLYAFKNRILFSAILSICIATGFELLQLFGKVNGTFDILDIIFQIAAVISAAGVIKRREKI